MKNLFLALIALAWVATQSSCKKEESPSFCQVSSWGLGTITYNLTYDDRGFVKRTWVNNSGYVEYSLNGAQLTRQGYDSTGTPTGSVSHSFVNSMGYYAIVPNSADTTFFTYNADGHLTEMMKRNDTFVSRTEFIYENGDITQAVSYNYDSTVSSTIVFEYYTDRVNNTNLYLLYDLLDSRYGKPTTHYVKSAIESRNGSIQYSNFSYTFDDAGKATHLRLINQPDNDVIDIDFNYLCN